MTYPVRPQWSGTGTWNGVSRLVLVIGQQNASRVARLNGSTLTTIAGLLPICSCPDCGSKVSTTKSPWTGT